ncbi:hypothetical protein B0H14DRAFT_3444966 [Mycena olivaceomarginata]|nr:hypothetical protein B0H14DRAFT_3444966 [Mycena olivaceomarginata]
MTMVEFLTPPDVLHSGDPALFVPKSSPRSILEAREALTHQREALDISDARNQMARIPGSTGRMASLFKEPNPAHILPPTTVLSPPPHSTLCLCTLEAPASPAAPRPLTPRAATSTTTTRRFSIQPAALALVSAAADNAYDTDTSDASFVDGRAATPTPQPIRDVSPASVIELSREDFPALATPVPPVATSTRAKTGKKNKGKKRAAQDIPEDDDPFLAADTAAAITASLGARTVQDGATVGASSSGQVHGSPPKRLRTDTDGNAAPAPVQAPIAAFTAHTTVPASAAAVPAPTVIASAPTAVPAYAAAAPAPVDAEPPVATAAPAPEAPTTYAAATALPNLAPAPAAVAQHIAANADAAAAGPLWMTADGNPPRSSYTPTPPGGFPRIVYSYALLTQGMPASLIQMYWDVPYPKFLISVSGGNSVTMQTHGLIRDAIGNFLNIDPTDFQLGTPPTADHGPSPTLWLVAGIPEHLADAVVQHLVISSGPRFVGTFGGFTLPNSPDGAAAARNLLQTAIRADNSIAQFVQTNRSAFGPQVSAEQAWQTFTDSVEGIELLVSNTVTVAWQLHVTPPTNDHDTWLNLRRLFGRLYVMTALHGSAPAKAQEPVRGNTAAGPSNPAPRSNAARNQGPAGTNKKARKPDGKGKKGGDPKGKGKRRDYDDFF